MFNYLFLFLFYPAEGPPCRAVHNEWHLHTTLPIAHHLLVGDSNFAEIQPKAKLESAKHFSKVFKKTVLWELKYYCMASNMLYFISPILGESFVPSKHMFSQFKRGFLGMPKFLPLKSIFGPPYFGLQGYCSAPNGLTPKYKLTMDPKW